MKDVFVGIGIAVLIAFVFVLWGPEITTLGKIMRENPFESFMIIGVGILISISLYGTFFKRVS
ncbi:hypothetical protein [Sporosarcina sp. BP05]|uniref:hypothetical protein n=1 Tax=Sporosarcina sp. BP05 TaxID=2758726 RepID=UPI00164934A8|nr:hypothetical protein [Sporosarcina sp. BP05]